MGQSEFLEQIESEALRKLLGSSRELLSKSRAAILKLTRCRTPHSLCRDCQAHTTLLLKEIEEQIGPLVTEPIAEANPA